MVTVFGLWCWVKIYSAVSTMHSRKSNKQLQMPESAGCAHGLNVRQPHMKLNVEKYRGSSNVVTRGSNFNKTVNKTVDRQYSRNAETPKRCQMVFMTLRNKSTRRMQTSFKTKLWKDALSCNIEMHIIHMFIARWTVTLSVITAWSRCRRVLKFNGVLGNNYRRGSKGGGAAAPPYFRKAEDFWK